MFLFHNYLDFTNAEDFLQVSYEICQDGEALYGGELELPHLPPHGEAAVELPAPAQRGPVHFDLLLHHPGGRGLLHRRPRPGL